MNELPDSLKLLLDDPKLRKKLVSEAKRELGFRKLDQFKPNRFQQRIIEATSQADEVLILGPNRGGKSEGGAAILARCLMGDYPADWPGHRFDRPITAVVASPTAELCRDSVQLKLLGNPLMQERWGEGLIRKACIGPHSMQRGVANAVDTVSIKHLPTGEWSTLMFRSYSRGREALQGFSASMVWCDESPPLDIYLELLTRTNEYPDRLILTTMTPLCGFDDFLRLWGDDPGAF